MILDIIGIIIISLLFVGLIVQTVYYASKYRRLIRNIAELLIEKEAIANKLEKLTLETSKEVNDGFIKFLSESREAAYEYIDGVQSAIKGYLNAIETNNDDAIVVARMELASYLPDSTPDKV